MTAKGERFFGLAEKKATKFDFFGFAKQANQEDAAELYMKAAAQFKLARDYERAGACYEKAAKCNMVAENEIEAKQNWRESGKCYRHVNFKKAQEAYGNAITLNLEADRYGQAARLQEEIGDMLVEDGHLQEAIAAFEQAADYYDAENDTGNKNKRLLKVAHMCGRAGDWQKAIDIYEKTANASCDNNLLRWKVKEYCFKAMLLQLCKHAEQDREKGGVNWQKVELIQERYCDISDIYASSRESKLITAILDAMPIEVIEFKDAVANHDRITRIDAWCTELLLHVERYMEWKSREIPDSELMGGGPGGGDNYTQGDASNNYNSNNNHNNNYNDGQPQSDPFDQGVQDSNGNGNNNSNDMNNQNSNYTATDMPPDLSGAPDANLL